MFQKQCFIPVGNPRFDHKRARYARNCGQHGFSTPLRTIFESLTQDQAIFLFWAIYNQVNIFESLEFV